MSVSSLRRWVIMMVLSFSGGIIFLLPFLQEVYYLPLVDALGLSNTQVGSLLSVFGVTSMLSYFPGGWLADRVSPRKLITSSLLLTSIGGFWFATFPSYATSLAIHATWGVTITLLFWGAMIRITRNWAPAAEQGRAFGILETGRGVGEIGASMAVLALFGALGSSSLALSTVVMCLSAMMASLGITAWFVLEDDVGRSADEPPIGLQEVLNVLRMPMVWAIALVVLAGYCAYWGTFRFTSYATDIFAMSVTLAAALSVGKMWLKPLGALVAGFVSDRFGIARSVSVLFVILILSFTAFAFFPGGATFLVPMIVNVALASLAVFAMRGIYFALLEEGGIPMAVTGTAAGVVSVVGFTPDIFMPLLGGVLLDEFPGQAGYRYFFLVTSGVCGLGLISALWIVRQVTRVGNEPGSHPTDVTQS